MDIFSFRPQKAVLLVIMVVFILLKRFKYDVTYISNESQDDYFRQIGEMDIYVYSAYLDQRFEGSQIVRIMALASTDTKGLWCKFGSTSINANIKLSLEHISPFGLWKPSVITCPVPKYMLALKYITLQSHDSQHKLKMKLKKVGKIIPFYNHKIGVCLKTLHHSKTYKDIGNLIEYFELQKIIGVSKVHLYGIDKCSEEVKLALQYYVRDGILNIIPWNIPFRTATWLDIDKDERPDFEQRNALKPPSVQYHGQQLAYYDCLYRFMDEYEFLAVTDHDEIIIPAINMTLIDMVSIIRQNNVDTISMVFQQARFCDIRGDQFDNELGIYRNTIMKYHQPIVKNKAVKSIIIPQNVRDVDIHKTRRPINRNISKVLEIDPTIAKLYHYRQGALCNETKVFDNSLQRLQKPLKIAIKRSMTEILKSISLYNHKNMAAFSLKKRNIFS